MRKLLVGFSAVMAITAGLCAQSATTAKKKTAAPAKKSAPASSASKSKSSTAKSTAPAKKSASSSKAAPARTAAKKAASKSRSKAAAKKPRTTWRNRQTAPTPDRYRQIQEALAARGFLDQEVATGQWGSESVNALKKFQLAQNLDATGKINSLSLIALGLGPRRDATTTGARASSQ